MASQRVLSGAGVTVEINGTDWGVITAVQLQMNTPHKPIPGIDSIENFELAPTSATVSGTIALLRVLGDGGLEGREITSKQPDVIYEKYFQLRLTERATGKLLFQANRCVVESQQWSYQTRALVQGSFSFTGLSWGSDASPDAF
jgi:hypothetical protein